ncbi:MAG: discoidin domain-containing protein, partial [Planctomycetes bacterium]|nr:discoidin domain-containing protein [Planctomycetota bacterium]
MTLVGKGQGDARFDYELLWTVFGDGCITLDARIEPEAMPPLPRLGFEMALSSELERIEWYGHGPHENYADRKAGAPVGRYRQRVSDFYVPYPKPQECGNREGVCWAALTGESGRGMLVIPRKPISMSALHFTAQDLAAAAHLSDLRPRPETILCLDIGQCGLGNASCGPGVLDEYALAAGPAEFGFTLLPYDENQTDAVDLAAARTPVIPWVTITRDHEGMVSLTCADPGARIHYTSDGSVPSKSSLLFRKPFSLKEGGVVKAQAYAEGSIESPITTGSFGFFVSRAQWKVVYVDSEQIGEGEARRAFDGRADTYWLTAWGVGEPGPPHELQIDLGEKFELSGFTCLPRQSSSNGRIERYEFYVSFDHEKWGRPVHIGFFNDSTPDSVAEGDAGAFRMSANRVQYVMIRDAAGNERGLNIDTNNKLAAVV